MPGRSCTSGQQCVTMVCENGKCKGRGDGESCAVHQDCDSTLFCLQPDEYPFTSTCKRQRTSYEPCTSSEQCGNYLYCWFGQKENLVQKSCLPLYSQFVEFNFGWRNKNRDPGSTEENPTYNNDPSFEDFEQNGRYCKSGLARRIPDSKAPAPSQTAECIDAVKIE